MQLIFENVTVGPKISLMYRPLCELPNHFWASLIKKLATTSQWVLRKGVWIKLSVSRSAQGGGRQVQRTTPDKQMIVESHSQIITYRHVDGWFWEWVSWTVAKPNVSVLNDLAIRLTTEFAASPSAQICRTVKFGRRNRKGLLWCLSRYTTFTLPKQQLLWHIAEKTESLWTYQVGAKVEPQLLEHLDEYGNIVSIGRNVSKLLR